MATEVFESPGYYTWFCPDDITTVTVECWGGGACGAVEADGACGGGGGAYARSVLTLSPGTDYVIYVGAGAYAIGEVGTPGSDGEASSFDMNVVVADGGKGGFEAPGEGGSVANSIGDVRHAGGRGGSRGTRGQSGGGGGSAGPNADGSNGSIINGAVAVAGGGPGGLGSDGVLGHPNESWGLAPASGPGGGGGGGCSGSGAGWDGKVVLTYGVSTNKLVILKVPF